MLVRGVKCQVFGFTTSRSASKFSMMWLVLTTSVRIENLFVSIISVGFLDSVFQCNLRLSIKLIHVLL